MADRALVGVAMGSDSDWPVMEAAVTTLAEFDVPYEVDVVSAHRTPRAMLEYGSTAADRGLRVLVAGAGGAAHLPGMLAAVTPLPVVGVAIPHELGPGADPEPHEHVAQVVVDGPGAEEQLCGHLLVAGPFGDQPHDLRLLRGKRAERARVSPPHRLAGCPQLAPRSLLPRRRA